MVHVQFNRTFAAVFNNYHTNMKKLILSAATLLAASSAFAGGYLTNTNQSVAFLRNPARLATFELDGAYSNPAGLAWLGEGWHFGFNIQNAAQTRNITSTYAPFAYNAHHLGQDTKRYKGEASAPIIPSFDIAYQKENWTLSAHFGITGGGGKATFNEGLPMFESQVAFANASTIQAVNGINRLVVGLKDFIQATGKPLGTIPTPKSYDFETYMSGRQYIFGLQMGMTYKIFDNVGDLKQGLSAHLGARMNFASNAYEGYMRNMKVTMPKDNKFSLGDYMNYAANNSKKTADYLNHIADHPMLAEQAEMLKQSAKTLAGAAEELEFGATRLKNEVALDCTQKGWGIAPILGLDYRIGNLNVGARYEFKTKMNIENKTKVNTTGSEDFADGVNTPNDIPSILAIGTQYNILDKVRVMAGWNCYFDKNAGMNGGKEKLLRHNTHEITAGAEWDINDRLTVSGGYQNTDYGASDAFQSDLSFHCDSYSLGFGAKMKLRKNLSVEAAYFWTNYKDYTKATDNYNGTHIAGKDVLGRTNRVFGLGINYSL